MPLRDASSALRRGNESVPSLGLTIRRCQTRCWTMRRPADFSLRQVDKCRPTAWLLDLGSNQGLVDKKRGGLDRRHRTATGADMINSRFRSSR
jgi:hypothetical protein